MICIARDAGIAQVVERCPEKAGVARASRAPGTFPYVTQMRSERVAAIRLRKSGRSYNEIARFLRVPKSTLATWFRDLVLPPRLVERLYSRARSAGTKALVVRNKHQTVLAQERATVIQQAARAEIGSVSTRELQLVGSALYWAEGTKR